MSSCQTCMMSSSNIFFLKILVSCLMYIYTPCVWPGAYGDQKRVSNPLELELRVAVNLHVSAEN